jgi:hypothetical protein
LTRRGLLYVLGITFRERELLDGEEKPEALAEVNGFQAARGEPPINTFKDQ